MAGQSVPSADSITTDYVINNLNILDVQYTRRKTWGSGPDLEQVPMKLNIKGPISLRKGVGSGESYKVTTS